MKGTKTKKLGTVNEKTLIVTVDIGKTVHHGYFRCPNGKDVKPFPFYNFRKSFQELWRKILQFKEKHLLEDIVIGFESTGPYAEPLVHFLSKKPARLVQINPMHTKRLKELTGNSPNKTDRKDPRVIADVISLGHSLTLIIPEGPAAELRRLTQARERAMKNRTSTINQLHHLIFLVFPEFTQVMKNIKTQSALYLLKFYPTGESIVSLGLGTLATLLKKVSCGRLQEERAKELFEAAQGSIGIQEGKESILLEVKHLVSNIESEERFINQLEKQIACCLAQIPYSRSILSIKGIGNITAGGLVGEVGDFGKFDTISEVMKVAGLDLYEVSSGKHKGQHHISKRGRSLFRKLLFYAAINMVRTKGIMHDRYQNMLDRGMPKMKALIAICRKLLRIIFALARDNTFYVDSYVHYSLAA